MAFWPIGNELLVPMKEKTLHWTSTALKLTVALKYREPFSYMFENWDVRFMYSYSATQFINQSFVEIQETVREKAFSQNPFRMMLLKEWGKKAGILSEKRKQCNELDLLCSNKIKAVGRHPTGFTAPFGK